MILSIDSPGGSVSGGETLHDAIARVAAKKPVVAVMGGLAASAGYMIAVPASRIFAREATLTGSIGVLLETGEVSGLLNKIGITAEVIRSGPLKDEPSLVRPLSPAGKDVLQGLVNDMYDQFVTIVATGRHMDAGEGPAAGRRAALYRPAGAGARAGRRHRRGAGGEGLARLRKGRIRRIAGRGCFHDRISPPGAIRAA